MTGDDHDHLRLAIDVGPLYGHRTGVGVATSGMQSALEARGDIRLDPYLVSGRSKPEANHRKLPLPGIVASHLWARSDLARADRWLGDVDVLHGTNYVAPPSSIPTVISVYDCWFLQHPDDASPVVRRAGRQLRRRAADGAWIHTSSDATAALARTLLDTDRVRTVLLGPPPEAVDAAATSADVPELRGETFVLAVGTEERRKDIPTLVEAFRVVADARPETRLVLAGAPGDHSAGIDAAIERLPHPTAAKVRRLGVVTAETKTWLLRHAAALAYPSLDEGFGFPVLEAQAAGVPVVATHVGSIPEVAGDGAILVEPESADELADAVLSVLDGRRSRLELITAGHENVGRFSWSATAAGLVGLYRQAIDS